MLHALQPRAPAAPVPTATTADGPAARVRRVLRCRQCARAIARPDDATAQQGSHEHIFVNPHGHDFRIRLYTAAAGAAAVGPATAFYSWFPGFPWRVLACGGCGVHLGWSYGVPESFVGLIVDRLAEEPDT